MLNRRLPYLVTTATCALVALTLTTIGCAGGGQRDNPRLNLPRHPARASHSGMISGPFDSPQAVTRACLKCHPAAAGEVMATSHWTWESDTAQSPLTGQTMRIGKKNLINNYCIGVQSNEPRCMSCHAGYGWKDSSFDFSNAENVDCLVCHESTGTYVKDPNGAGMPAAGVDLEAVAKSVDLPTRRNCGYCHFAGGGGDAVKHGDMDGTMNLPNSRIDVHMGRFDLQCQDCHRTKQHVIGGRLLSVSNRSESDAACTDCHSARPHAQERLNAHTDAVSCQACHIPRYAIETATKMSWDWSQAGQDITPEDAYLYDKKKGRFEYASQVIPEYLWYDGSVEHYLPGQRIDPAAVVSINRPAGTIHAAKAKLWPFKVHRGKQIYDAVNRYLMVPKTFGPGGYWTEFDWDQALRLGSASTGLPYSGKYGFVATEMYWPITHMVAPKSAALQCSDCHGANGRLDWQALGYEGDPLLYGGRVQAGLVTADLPGERP